MIGKFARYINPWNLSERDSVMKRRTVATLHVWGIFFLIRKLAIAEEFVWGLICKPFFWIVGILQSIERKIVETAAIWGCAEIPGSWTDDPIKRTVHGFYSERPSFKHLKQLSGNEVMEGDR